MAPEVAETLDEYDREDLSPEWENDIKCEEGVD
jgi:hypothetical protein